MVQTWIIEHCALLSMVQINCYVLFIERDMPNNCIVCGWMKVPGPGLEISLHQFPKSHVLRSKWLEGLSLAEVDVGPDSRVRVCTQQPSLSGWECKKHPVNFNWPEVC